MKKVLLLGQPNVGKSTFLNALTGAKVVISNYPGTTVDLSKGHTIIDGERYLLIDTPGVYNLFPSSEEEKITERMVMDWDYDFIIQIVDCGALERGLIITLQLIELGIPVIIALNFVEESEKRGVSIDEKRLENILKIPVAKINPLRKNGLSNLLKRIKNVTVSSFKIQYDDHIEKAISKIESVIDTNSNFSSRGIAIKILEKDPIVCSIFNKKLDVKFVSHPNISMDVQVTRSGYASMLAKSVTELKSHREILNNLDRIVLLNNWTGTIYTISIFSLIFGTLLYLGGWFQNILTSYSDKFMAYLHPFLSQTSPFLKEILENSIIGMNTGISIAIPYIGIFYIILAILEDSGLLSRFIVILNRLFERFWLPGKAIIPLMLGLGCTVPAIRATRILGDMRDRLKISILFFTVPCSSRAAIIFGVVGHFAGLKYALGIYLVSFIVMILTARILKIIIKREPTPLIEELPPYRIPKLRNIILKSWIRTKDFVYIVIPLLIFGGMIYGVLVHFNLVNVIVRPLRPVISGWLKLPEKSAISLFYGFLQKDLTPAMLTNALGTINFSNVMTPLQLFTFGLASTFQIPCIIAFGMLIREFGIKRALMVEIVVLIYSLLIVGLILRFLLLF